MRAGTWLVLLLEIVAAAALMAQPHWRDIREFGAVPNDGQDDSEAIQAAFDSVDAKRGGTVYCPPGTYDVFEPLVVTGAALRITGDAGPSYNEDAPLAGCVLLARTDSMTLLKFDGGSLNHRGAIVEYLSLRDATPAGHTATLIEMRHVNRWTVRNVSAGYAAVSLKVSAGTSDASWGYVPQFVCRDSITCIEQAHPEGGFLAVGGDLSASGTGVRVRGAQARVVGVKFDCANGGVGVHITGHAGVVSSSMFEQCQVGVRIADDASQPWNGERNRIVGNHFRGWDKGVSKGVEIGPNCNHTQVLGNTYEAVTTPVEDRGGSTKRYEMGVGANANLNCPGGQAVKGISVKEGIVTDVVCGAP